MPYYQFVLKRKRGLRRAVSSGLVASAGLEQIERFEMAPFELRAQDVVQDPAWLAHRFDTAKDAVHFIRVSRETHRAAPFLIDEYLAGHDAPVAVPRAEALSATTSKAPIHFIFHSAYCCSTLLAQALDIEGVSFALKEPVILNDISGWRRRGAAPADLARALDMALTLLARPFADGETVLVKPSNVINPFIPAILAMRPKARALLLYAPLRTYLGSIATKGMWGRLWVRELFVKLADAGLLDYGFSAEETMRQTDLQIAAVGWLGQHRLFAALVERFPERVRTLNSETFLGEVEGSVERLAALFDLKVNAVEVAASEAFRRNSKDGAEFNAEQRRSAQQQAEFVHFDEIDKVAKWAEAVAASAKQDLELASPLVAG